MNSKCEFCFSALKQLKKQYTIVVHGNSMSPGIHDGQVLSIVPIAFDSIQKGDIILYKKCPDHLTLHRVVSFVSLQGQKVIQTRGDNNLESDDYYVFPEDILGKVVIEL